MQDFQAAHVEASEEAIAVVCVVVFVGVSVGVSVGVMPGVPSARLIRTSMPITQVPISRWAEDFVWMAEGIMVEHLHTVVAKLRLALSLP